MRKVSLNLLKSLIVAHHLSHFGSHGSYQALWGPSTRDTPFLAVFASDSATPVETCDRMCLSAASLCQTLSLKIDHLLALVRRNPGPSVHMILLFLPRALFEVLEVALWDRLEGFLTRLKSR